MAFPRGRLLFVGLTAGTLRVTDSVPDPPAVEYTELYVSAGGSDSTGTGAASNPWATPQKAVDEIVSQGLNVGMTQNLRINIAAGEYWDTDLTIDDTANPDNGYTITMRASDGINTVRLVGGHVATGWEVYSGNVMRCAVPADADFWTLFENGERARSARFPKYVHDEDFPCASEPFLQAEAGTNDYTTLTYANGDFDPTAWVTEDVQIWGTESNGVGVRWFTGVTPVTDIDIPTRTFTFPENTKYKNGARYYIVQNDLSFLTEAGEWYLDRTDAHGAPGGGGHYLYYYPRSTPIADQEIVYPTTLDAVSLIGTDANNPVSGWVFEDLTIEVSDFLQRYRYATWGTGLPGDFDPALCAAHPDGCGFDFERAQPEAQHGLIHLKFAQDITFNRVRVRRSGLAGLYAQMNITGVVVKNSLFEHCGFDALQFEGDYPADGDINNNNTIRNTWITNPGELLQHGVGIRFAQSGHKLVVNCLIEQGPRNAIFITDMAIVDSHDGYAIGNRIAFTAIDSMCQDTGDVGAIGFFGLGSGASTTTPHDTNYVQQVTINNTGAHPGQTDADPNAVFCDNQTYFQNFQNVQATNTQGAQQRNNESGTHTEVNVSWAAGFDAFKMSDEIGLTSENPYA